MSTGLIAKKLGMISLFTPEGQNIPATVLQAGPCVVTQIKTKDTDGYNALQLAFSERKKSRVNKPLRGHMLKSKKGPYEILKEFEVENIEDYTLGQTVDLNIFKVGEQINISGTTKGRGFSGVIKRHGFHGGKKTHGSHSHRIPGSIGCSAWPGKVIKGKKLPGQYGCERKTIKNLEIVDIRPEENILILKGAVPGAKSGFVEIHKTQK